jgi:hypothetical protein
VGFIFERDFFLVHALLFCMSCHYIRSFQICVFEYSFKKPFFLVKEVAAIVEAILRFLEFRFELLHPLHELLVDRFRFHCFNEYTSYALRRCLWLYNGWKPFHTYAFSFGGCRILFLDRFVPAKVLTSKVLVRMARRHCIGTSPATHLFGFALLGADGLGYAGRAMWEALTFLRFSLFIFLFSVRPFICIFIFCLMV